MTMMPSNWHFPYAFVIVSRHLGRQLGCNGMIPSHTDLDQRAYIMITD